MLKAIVFDLDGTLLNTLEDLCNATNYAIEKYGYNCISIDTTKCNIGRGIRNLILKSVDMDETHIDSMFLAFKEYYSLHCMDYTKPYDGILDVLYKLKKDGYILACISNKAKYALGTICDHYFNGIFDEVIGDLEGYKRKPDPDMLIECAKRLNVSLEEFLYIGDSDTDVLTVQNACCHGLFVSYGFRDKEVLVKLGAKNIVDTPNAIYNWIKENTL